MGAVEGCGWVLIPRRAPGGCNSPGPARFWLSLSCLQGCWVRAGSLSLGMRTGIITVGAEGTVPAHRGHVEKPEVAALLPQAPWKNGELVPGVLQGPSCSHGIFAKG